MKIRWEVEDGYAGPARPHFLNVPDEELEGLSETEQDIVIEQYVDSAFNDLISYFWERT
jgi:hypothetical protein